MRYLNNFPYQNVLVLGLAKSGRAAAQILLENNVFVRVNDLKAKDDDDNVIELRRKGVEVVLGMHPLALLDDVDLIVKNPGIPYSNLLLVKAVERNIPIVTEIELISYLVDKENIIGITGSNGKTTTTTLVYEMLQKSRPVKLAGNIGVVASEVAQTLETNEKLLLELSSFQLMGTVNFTPHIAALLNLYDAHLDYHGSVEEYELAKQQIFNRQASKDFLIYNADDDRVKKLIGTAKAKLVPFSMKEKYIEGTWINDGIIYYKTEPIIKVSDIVLVGNHNMANILAAISIAILNGATKIGINEVLTNFTGVKHRLQFVQNIHGRYFYNDSKATNILATEKALQSFIKPIILLAGGLDRGEDFANLVPFMKHVKALVLFGETAEKIAKETKAKNIEQIIFADNVYEAAIKAYEISKEEDVILLSPACASWDQYESFEVRGDMFIDAVHTLM